MRKVYNKKILHIETFPETPIIETSVEIALNSKKNNVYFFWCGYNLPWVDWEISFFKKLLGFNYNGKIKKIENILKLNQINVISKINLDYKLNYQIYHWANRFNEKKNLKKYYINYNSKKINLGLSVESSLLSIYKNFDYKNDTNLIRKALISSATVFFRAINIIDKINPEKIITFNNRFCISRPIIEAANIRNIKVERHEVGSSREKYEIFKHDVHDLKQRGKAVFDYWKKENKKQRLINANKYFAMPYKNTKLINTGSGVVKSFSFNQDKSINFKTKNKKIITYFTSSGYEFEAISENYKEYTNSKEFKNQSSAVNTLVSVINKLKNCLLVIRVHPSQKNSKFENNFWRKYKINKKILFIESQSRINSFDLLKKSDFVVTYGSSLAVHAAYNNKPSIVLRNHLFSRGKILIEPKNKSDLFKILNRKYNLNTRKKCLPYGNYLMSFGKKFKYYKRDTVFKGYILGLKLNHYGFFVNVALCIIKPFLKLLNIK